MPAEGGRHTVTAITKANDRNYAAGRRFEEDSSELEKILDKAGSVTPRLSLTF